MGEVYRAQDARLGRDVAIKVLPAEFSADAVRKQRFEREAKTISSLNHPNICVLYDVGSQEGMDYLVMEFVEGETLAKRLEKSLPIDQVLKSARRSLEGWKGASEGNRPSGFEAGKHHADVGRREIAGFWTSEPALASDSLATMTAVKQVSRTLR